ncbi:MAG: AgmX/PglI C-terminal domain-containing protein, partial [Myxococcaceae bacterium]|nr:AgmX/PglI C-terminal domain-containing protein [Myxococcaceae bacterium]
PAPARRPAPAPARAAPAAAARRRVSVPAAPSASEGKRKPALFLELYWGETRKASRSYAHIPDKKPVVGAPDDQAGMPLWGFKVPEGGFVFARQKGEAFRIAVPPGAAVERRADDGNFYPLPHEQLEPAGQGKAITLSTGMAVRFSGEDDMSLVAYVQPPLKTEFVNPLAGMPWLLLFLLVVMGAAGAAVIMFAPSLDGPDFQGKSVAPVAVRLIAPSPKKKEEAQKRLEELKPKKKEEPKPVVEKTPPPKALPPPVAAVTPPETQKALKSLEKLTAAGPAMKDLLAAVDKLGNGPGKKDAKNDFKLSGLLGKAPIANAGLGTFGLGGGGAGGAGTKGLEVLRGKGGAGIGALGAGNVGKGAVQGTVARASTRAIGVQGTIDREAVAKVINSHLAEVSACYERALLKEAGLQGKIVLEWNISTVGQVTTARTKSSSMKSAAVESCILASLKTWKFPPAKGAGVVISYPFLFNSVGY